jgi:hypothetical protein
MESDMPRTIDEMVRNWSMSYDAPDSLSVNIDKASIEEMDVALATADNHYPSVYERIKSQINYLASNLYEDYEVTKYPPHHQYHQRLHAWLNNVSDEDTQKALFELAPRIYFIGINEYLSLYHTAFNGPIARWLIDQENIDITQSNAQSLLEKSLSSTWFCAITDSMLISRFYHINQLEGTDLRPDWRVLKRFTKKDKIVKYMEKRTPPVKRIVLLEDFVATGSQIKNAVRSALTLRDDAPYPVFLCPLVICRSGYEMSKQFVAEFPHLSFEPALVLDDSVVLSELAIPNEDEFYKRLRNVVNNTYNLVKGTDSKNIDSAFGFGADRMGGGLLLVLYTNCPNNTLPLIHHKSDTPWHPIFPRSSRV